MTLKQLIDESLDASTALMQVSELQKISDAVNKIPDVKLNEPSINQQKQAFLKLVQAQLQQKKIAAQQLQAAQAAQAAQQNNQQSDQQNSSQISTLAQ